MSPFDGVCNASNNQLTGDKPRLLRVCGLNTHPHNQHVNRGWPPEKRGVNGEMLIWLKRRPGLRTFEPRLSSPLLCSEVRTHETLKKKKKSHIVLLLLRISAGISTNELIIFLRRAHFYSAHAFGRNLHSKFRHWRVIYASNQTHFEVGKTAEGPGSTHDAFYKYSLHVPMKTQLSNAEFLFVPLQISYTLKRTATS